jgi:carbon monoxide dehydrogenase subunit G
VRFSGTVTIRTTREQAFAFVTDPMRMGPCGPGVESIEVIDATHWRARAKVGVGFISARFTVDLELTEAEAPDRAVIRAHGKAPGSAVDATGRMNLVDGDEPGTTLMVWAADVVVTGTIASVGSRLIEGTAHKLIGQTFTCVQARLEAEGGP